LADRRTAAAFICSMTGLIGDSGLNRQFLGQQKIPPVSLRDFHHLTAAAQLGHVFFQDASMDDSVS